MLQTIVWLLPACLLKNIILRRFGHTISASANIGPAIVIRVGNFMIGDDARIGLLNVFRGLSTVRLDGHAVIESWNWISAHPAYQKVDPKAGTLFVGYGAKIGSRNYLDCSGTIVMRPYSHVGGNRCLLQTHEPEFVRYRQTVGRITVGRHSMVSSCAVMLKGAYLPDKSLLGANSTMTGAAGADGKPGLYAGSPAVWKRETHGEWFERTTHQMDEHIVEGVMGILPEDAALDR
jgi:acetyltransferase-like isoleucine patch superfamily enzyme